MTGDVVMAGAVPVGSAAAPASSVMVGVAPGAGSSGSIAVEAIGSASSSAMITR